MTIEAEKLPLADDLEKAGLDARGANQDTFMVELPWKAGPIIAEALREYFSPDRSQFCIYCMSHRELGIDRAIDVLLDTTYQLSCLMAEVETICTEQVGVAPPHGNELTRERLRTEIKTGLYQQRMQARRPTQRIPVSDELRAVVREWPKDGGAAE